MTDLVELMSTLTKLSVNWDLEVNPHTVNYETMEAYRDYMNHRCDNVFDDGWVGEQPLEDAENLYELRCYVFTPVASYSLCGADLISLFTKMVAVAKEDRVRRGYNPDDLLSTSKERLDSYIDEARSR